MSENYFMDDKLFLFFFRKLGSTTINGNEYAYCCPWNLEINENGELVVAGVIVDREGNFYNLEWLQFGNENWGNPVIKKIGKFKELPEKIINKIESYLEKIERREGFK